MKTLAQIISDIKKTMYHKNMGIIYIQARYKDGRFWILKSNGESLTISGEDVQGTTKVFKLAMYVGAKLCIPDADKLSPYSLEKLATDFLLKEEDVALAVEFSEIAGLDCAFNPSIEDIEAHGLLASDYTVSEYDEIEHAGFVEIYAYLGNLFHVCNWIEGSEKGECKEVIKRELIKKTA